MCLVNETQLSDSLKYLRIVKWFYKWWTNENEVILKRELHECNHNQRYSLHSLQQEFHLWVIFLSCWLLGKLFGWRETKNQSSDSLSVSIFKNRFFIICFDFCIRCFHYRSPLSAIFEVSKGGGIVRNQESSGPCGGLCSWAYF